MRILILSQYFTPEVMAPSARLHPFARTLAQRGHDVEVICEAPNYPSGVVHEGYGRRVFDRRELDGFAVNYVRVHASPSKRARSRVALYASYAGLALAAGSRGARPDVVLASSPPLSVGAAGALVARRWRVPWAFDVRDLWPEAAVVLGELSNRRLIAAAERLERSLYAGAEVVTTPTAPFRDHILARAPAGARVELIANGTTAAWIEAGRAEPEPGALGDAPAGFAWAFAGNVGLSQDLDTAVRAAAELGPAFPLLIVGEGSSRQRVEALATELRAPVTFAGLVSPEQAARILRASQAVLVSLADDPALGKSVPVKLYDSAAIGRPVIVAAPGESRRLAEAHGFALTVAPGDPQALAAAVRRLEGDQALRERLAAAGPKFAAENLRDVGALRMAQLVEALG